MPKAKPKPSQARSALLNGSIPEVLTLDEAAAYLRFPAKEVLRLIREHGLPARQVGSQWRFLLTAIRDWLRSGQPPESNKQAWMGLVGLWKDDPTVDELREEIARQRRES